MSEMKDMSDSEVFASSITPEIKEWLMSILKHNSNRCINEPEDDFHGHIDCTRCMLSDFLNYKEIRDKFAVRLDLDFIRKE